MSRLLVTGAVALVVAAGCGGDDDDTVDDSAFCERAAELARADEAVDDDLALAGLQSFAETAPEDLADDFAVILEAFAARVSGDADVDLDAVDQAFAAVELATLERCDVDLVGGAATATTTTSASGPPALADVVTGIDELSRVAVTDLASAAELAAEDPQPYRDALDRLRAGLVAAAVDLAELAPADPALVAPYEDLVASLDAAVAALDALLDGPPAEAAGAATQLDTALDGLGAAVEALLAAT